MNDKNDHTRRDWWWAGVALIWLVASLWLVYQKWAQIKGLALPDTDDNMRLQQVRDWLGGQPWFDLRQHRMLPPEGADIHWSRLVDIPIAGLILFFKLFASTAFAERAAAAIAPVLPLGVAMAALALTARKLVDRDAWAFPPMLLMFALMTLAMMSPLRIDHHGWQIALLVVMIHGMVMDRRTLGGVISGVALGLSLAIGIELLPYLGITAVLIALFWAADREEAPRIAAFGASAAGMTALALLVFVPPDRRWMGMCDALSVAHMQAMALGGAGLFVLALLPIRNAWLRLGAIGVLGALVTAFIYARYPQCLGDPSALIDPDARRLWLANVREARPIYRQSIPVQVGTLSPMIFGLIGLGIALWTFRHDALRLRRWGAVGALATFGFAFCFFQTRAGPAAQALAVPGGAMLCWWSFGLLSRISKPVPRIAAIAASLYLISGLGFQAVVEALPASKNSPGVARANRANKDCALLTALKPLDQVPAGTMFTFLDLSPRLIVATHHSAITGPYHRNGRAIADVMTAFGSPPDAARAIVMRRHADYVLICPGVGEATIYQRRAPKGFYADLAAGRAPAWLEPVPLAGDTPYRLWRVKDR